MYVWDATTARKKHVSYHKYEGCPKSSFTHLTVTFTLICHETCVDCEMKIVFITIQMHIRAYFTVYDLKKKNNNNNNKLILNIFEGIFFQLKLQIVSVTIFCRRPNSPFLPGWKQ